MRNFAIFLNLLCSLFTGIGAIDEDANFALAGYLPDYRLRDYIYRQMPGKKIDSRSRLPMTDLILFSLQPHARGFFGCCLQEDHYNLVEEYLNSTMQMPFLAPTIRVWITLGGGGRTEAFPEICANSRLRQRLIGSVMNLRYDIHDSIALCDDVCKSEVVVGIYDDFTHVILPSVASFGIAISTSSFALCAFF